MTNGYIHRIATLIVTICYYTNLVEGFKWLLGKLTKDKKRAYKNFAIDTFILLKWIFLILLWCFNAQSFLLTIVVSYLIWTNLFTYFYYHVWKTSKVDETERNQRRFVNLILAFTYSNVSFAYLYSLEKTLILTTLDRFKLTTPERSMLTTPKRSMLTT
jgi:hypothetical protein